MPGFSISFNIDCCLPAKNADADTQETKDEQHARPNNNCKLLAGIGMCIEATIAIYFLVRLFLTDLQLPYFVVSLLFCLLFILGSLIGLVGLLKGNVIAVGLFCRLQHFFLLSAVFILTISIFLLTDTWRFTDRYASFASCGYRCLRHAGVHGVLLSVLGSLCAVFCAYYAKKCQEELRQAAKPATIVDDIPPSYKASTTAPLLVASDADMTPVEPSNSQII